MSALNREIFVVLAAENYEGNDPVRAFERMEDADAFAKECRDYEATYEQTPPMDAAQEDWDKWLEDNRAWESKHPAAPFTRRDNYVVVPLQLSAPTQGADGESLRPVAIYQVRFKGQFKWLDVEQAGYDLRHGEEYERRIVYATRDAAPSDAQPVADMRMLVQRLAHSLRRAAPDNALSDQAMDYLKRTAPVGSPLRDGDQS